MMKNTYLLFIAIVLLLGSCKKDLAKVDQPTTIPAGSTIESIVVPSGFDWSTTKHIDVEIILPEDEGVMRSKIFSVDGTKLYYKGYPSDTTQRVLNTKITIPAGETTFIITNGIGRNRSKYSGQQFIL